MVDENSEYAVHPVGKKAPNSLDIYDMSGNVWEWCYDWYLKDYYSNTPQVDPEGPVSGTHRVLRGGCWGGSWGLVTGCLRCAYRGSNYPSTSINSIGFRMVVSSF